ncbi:hypothetical protein Tco_1443553, partial [Tanacetum coccineum]
MYAPKEANIRDAQGRKVIAPNQRDQTEQWEGTIQSGKERVNFWEGQSTSHPNGSTLGKNIQEEDHAKLFTKHKNIFPTPGSASEILYEHCFSRLCPKVKNQLVPATTPLIGFSVVRSPFPYNGIIGRPGVRKLQAVSSTVHEMLKIL